MEREQGGGLRGVAAVLHEGEERLHELGVVRLVVLPQAPDGGVDVVHQVDVVVHDIEHLHVGVLAVAVDVGVVEDLCVGGAVAHGGARLSEVGADVGDLAELVAHADDQVVGQRHARERRLVGLGQARRVRAAHERHELALVEGGQAVVEHRLELTADALGRSRVQGAATAADADHEEIVQGREAHELHAARARHRVRVLVVEQAPQEVRPLLRAAEGEEARLLELLGREPHEEGEEFLVALGEGMVVLDHHRAPEAGAVHHDRGRHRLEGVDRVHAHHRPLRPGELLVDAFLEDVAHALVEHDVAARQLRARYPREDGVVVLVDGKAAARRVMVGGVDDQHRVAQHGGGGLGEVCKPAVGEKGVYQRFSRLLDGGLACVHGDSSLVGGVGRARASAANMVNESERVDAA